MHSVLILAGGLNCIEVE